MPNLEQMKFYIKCEQKFLEFFLLQKLETNRQYKTSFSMEIKYIDSFEAFLHSSLRQMSMTGDKASKNFEQYLLFDT